jgi:hypothetical protein
MRKGLYASTVAAFLAFGLFCASGQAPVQPRGVLTVLHPGQLVGVTYRDGCYEICGEGLPAQTVDIKVVEVGSDYLVLQYPSMLDSGSQSPEGHSEMEARIPIYSIKAVMTKAKRAE